MWNDISTWKRNAPELARIARQFEWITGELGPSIRRPDLGVWAQDDWTISPRLTLNLGVRYDVSFNKFANDVEVLPFLPAGRKDDMNNVAPRIGFAYSPNERTVVRGGFGLYFVGLGNTIPTQNIQAASTAQVVVVNDGRPDFVVNPFNGPAPTRDQISCTRKGAQHHRPDQQCDARRAVRAIRRRLASSGRSGTRWRSRST